jgi:amino acid transporter
MVFIIYGAACGGAFGLEEMVSGSGPGISLITLAIMPFLWSIPIALACSELASAFPLEGGYYQWCRIAFGDRVGYLTAWWTWVGIFATNATFVVMFNQYLGYWIHLSWGLQYLVSLSLIWGVTDSNIKGIEVVGQSSTWMTIILLLPFVVLIGIGLSHWQVNPFVPLTHPEKRTLTAFGEAMMIGVWLYSGYDKITVSAEEVENPSRNFPRAFGIAVPFVAASYFLPTLASLAANGHWSDWHEGYFSDIAGILGGPALGHAMTAAALLSSMVLLNTTMLAQSRLPMAMVKNNLAPKFFSKLHPKYQTPVVSLIFGSVVLSILCISSFSQLITIYSVTQMLGYMLIYAALWKLRRSHPDVARPFQVPGGGLGLLILSVPPMIIAVLTLAKTENILLGTVAVLSGPVTYLIWKLSRRKYEQSV